MSFKKKILKSQLVIFLAAGIIYFYIKLVKITSRWEVVNYKVAEEYASKPAIVAFWHSRLLMIPPFVPRKAKINVVISHHSDGELIAKVQSFFGFKTIRGSSSKGGVKALREIIQAKKRGEIIVITPDGPRGPAQKVGGNAAEIAKLLELPIIPVTYSFKNAKIANTWDSFLIPRPFGKGVFAVGTPIMPENANTLENALNELTKKADES